MSLLEKIFKFTVGTLATLLAASAFAFTALVKQCGGVMVGHCAAYEAPPNEATP